jgi:hypothetical protein
MGNTQMFIEITFPMKNEELPSINTNIKQELVSDLLADWLRATQIGKGKDNREVKERDVYHIGIDIDFTDDSFTTKADTNNHGLTCGIVMYVMKKIEIKEVVWK